MLRQFYSFAKAHYGSTQLRQCYASLATKVGTTNEIIERMKNVYNQKNVDILCYYNSDINLIVQDKFLMQMPIDDRIINRSHGIFDSITVQKYKILKLKQHLERFQFSASALGIPIPFKEEELIQILEDVTVVAYKQLQPKYDVKKLSELTLMIRFWLSSGKGDFGIYSYNKKPILYTVVYLSNVPTAELQSKGVKDYSFKQNELHEQVSRAKSTNYVESSLMANLAKQRGGYQGIKLTEDSIILEAAMSNLGFLLKNKEFVVCPPDNIVQGTTLLKCLEFIKKDLAEQGLISKVVVRKISIQEAIEQSEEIISFGGNKIIPILQVDDQNINRGEIGEACKALQQWYTKFMKSDQQDINDKDSHDISSKLF